MVEKRDEKAEKMIDTLVSVTPGVNRADISTIFYLGATYANGKAQEKLDKVRKLLSKFGESRVNRITDVGREL